MTEPVISGGVGQKSTGWSRREGQNLSYPGVGQSTWRLLARIDFCPVIFKGT